MYAGCPGAATGCTKSAEEPEWTRSPGTGRYLELDGYCEELRLAMEFNGPHHYGPVTWVKEAFEVTAAKDRFKREAAAREGVTLVEVDGRVTDFHYRSVKRLVEDSLRAAGVGFPADWDRDDYNPYEEAGFSVIHKAIAGIEPGTSRMEVVRRLFALLGQEVLEDQYQGWVKHTYRTRCTLGGYEGSASPRASSA